jgi:arylsulfatase A-like enzyme
MSTGSNCVLHAGAFQKPVSDKIIAAGNDDSITMMNYATTPAKAGPIPNITIEGKNTLVLSNLLAGDVKAETPRPDDALITPAKPNIVFLLADDQRFDELGCTGDPIVKTPNIDRLAREGILFKNSFAPSPSCMPNRTSLLTGQWERRHTVGWNSKSALSPEQWKNTLPMVLKSHGYCVAYVGKNHTPGLRPWDFDYYYGSLEDHLRFYPKKHFGVFKNAEADTQIEIIAEGAGNFLETSKPFLARADQEADVFLKSRPKDKPFFLYVCFNVPHGSSTLDMKQLPTDDVLYRTAYREVMDHIPPPAGYIAAKQVMEPKIPLEIYNGKQISSYDYRFTLEALREQRIRISQTVNGIDLVVGKIHEQLEQLGLAENTIIVYSSDNGILHGEHGYGGKALLYDPSIRVPLIICDPRLPANRRGVQVPELVTSPDVAPTILDLCGLKAPESMQGQSLIPLMRGQDINWRQDFFCEGLIQLQNYPVMQAVRSANWKYIRYWPNAPVPTDYRDLLNWGLNGEAPAYEELFNLASDPLEQKNLVGDHANEAQLAAMRVRCLELLRETRGNPQFLPTIPPEDWLSEAPPAWKDILPLLSAKKN